MPEKDTVAAIMGIKSEAGIQFKDERYFAADPTSKTDEIKIFTADRLIISPNTPERIEKKTTQAQIDRSLVAESDIISIRFLLFFGAISVTLFERYS